MVNTIYITGGLKLANPHRAVSMAENRQSGKGLQALDSSSEPKRKALQPVEVELANPQGVSLFQ